VSLQKLSLPSRWLSPALLFWATFVVLQEHSAPRMQIRSFVECVNEAS
jgi:hypothetical protein